MWYRWDGDALVLTLRIQPKASSDAFAGPYGDDSYRVRITAPPVDGKANRQLTAFLAKAFGVPRSAVHLLSGEISRDKRFRIDSPTRLPLQEISR